VVTVGKVQVGLLANARELQQDLERIADRADTDSPEGLHYIMQGGPVWGVWWGCAGARVSGGLLVGC
jgi:uncharacterized membrane protein